MTAPPPVPVPRKPAAASGEALAALSVVLPVRDEAGSVGGVIDELFEVLGRRFALDVVAVDDGSGDGSGALLARRATAGAGLTVVRHAQAAGQSAALRSGARTARSEWLVLMDGDGQYDPGDIPRLLAALDAAAQPVPALVYGIRVERRDARSKRFASRAANRLRRWLLRDGCPDSGCGLKLIDREVFLGLPFFGGLHRFLPALVQGQGYRTVGIPVGHRPRRAGRSKYGNAGRALVGAVDLFGAMWLVRRTPRPEATVIQPAERGRADPR